MENQTSTRIKKELNSDRYIRGGQFPRIFFAGLKQRTVIEGGSTNFWSHCESKCNTRGYIVADGKNGVTVSKRDFRSGLDLESFLAPYIERWLQNEEYHGFGTWVSFDEELVYIDPITAVDFRVTARTLASERGETCFRDVENKTELYLS